MLERQREGIAKAAGKYKGRPTSIHNLLPHRHRVTLT